MNGIFGLNPNFVVLVGLFSGIGYLINGGRGALIGALIAGSIGFIAEFLEKIK